MKTNRDYSVVNAFVQRLLAKLGENVGPVIDRGLANEEYLQEVTEKMADCGYQPTKAHIEARKIMGENMFGIRTAIETFGVYPLRRQLHKFAEIRTPRGRLITPAELKQCSKTHILVAVFRVWPLVGISGPLRDHMFYTRSSHRLFHQGIFSIDESEEGWYLIRKTGTPDTQNKEFIHQIQILGKRGEIPKTHVLAYMMAGHFASTGERLFVNQSMRCATEALQLPDSRAVIRYSENDGLCLGVVLDSVSSEDVWLASMQPL